MEKPTVKIEDNEDLLLVLAQHPTFRIVTDVGASMCSGWGTLNGANIYEDDKIIELVFD